VRLYPALRIRLADPAPSRVDELLAILDDFQVTAVDDSDDDVRVFFTRESERDAAFDRLRSETDLTVSNEDVPDEDWAARSQAGIGPVEVIGLTIAPPWAAAAARSAHSGQTIVIQPSMGFGTGHHPSTRLCLRLLQQTLLTGRSVLDVGTGSGVLAIAAAVLGAGRVTGVDVDPDALANARENLELNGLSGRVELIERDLSAGPGGLERSDVVLANLTGGWLCRDAATLAGLVAPGGCVIASGFQTHELADVTSAFAASGLSLAAKVEEASWIGASFTIPILSRLP
jgi:ribosomal protein L11 methyltransferase